MLSQCCLVIDQEHLVLVSSSVNHFTTWSASRFVAHHLNVEKIASVAFNTHIDAMSIAFDATKVSVALHLVINRGTLTV